MLSDRNWASLMCRLADVRLQLRENSMTGLGRSAGEAQQGTGSWLQALSDIRLPYIRLRAGNLEFPAKTNGRKFRSSLEIGLSDRA